MEKRNKLAIVLARLFWWCAPSIRKILHRTLHDKWVRLGFIKPQQDADEMVMVSMHGAFDRFRDPRFRTHVRFTTLDEGEQNRIFNEMILTAMLSLKVGLDGYMPVLPPERKPHWQLVQEQIVPRFYTYLRNSGIAAEYHDIWKKCWKVREKEFWERSIDVRASLQEQKLLFSHHPVIAAAQTRINTIGISSTMHLTRGKSEPGDAISNYMFKWVSDMDKQLFNHLGLRARNF